MSTWHETSLPSASRSRLYGPSTRQAFDLTRRDDLDAEALGLGDGAAGEVGAGEARGEAEVVLDPARRAGLPARRLALDEHGAQPFATRRRPPPRARPARLRRSRGRRTRRRRSYAARAARPPRPGDGASSRSPSGRITSGSAAPCTRSPASSLSASMNWYGTALRARKSLSPCASDDHRLPTTRTPP